MVEAAGAVGPVEPAPAPGAAAPCVPAGESLRCAALGDESSARAPERCLDGPPPVPAVALPLVAARSGVASPPAPPVLAFFAGVQPRCA